MNKAQEETIRLLVELVSKDDSIIALILCGSIARGTETDISDVDVYVVVSDERFESEKLNKNYFWGTNFDSVEFSVEVDGKIIPKDFLEKVWERGNECVKSTLRYSKVLFSRDSDIENLLSNYQDYTQKEKKENMRKFYSLMKSSRYSGDDDLSNIIYVNKCIYDTVLYASRLVLAYNDILFPCVKNIRKELLRCVNMPKDFIKLMNEVMESYSFDKLVEFYDGVEGYFKDIRFDDRLRKGYVLENELFWYFKTYPYDVI